ncbi:MAG: peptidoglycan DD-metalloendopeptidase family protein [Gammaproteobacteria bacterium]|uniref:M23 family metallopeptidase n=1 Tax=Rhodoferax sp. TaxID=50421 RepID=UPI00182D98F8|nr:peptidoglycan DD-metalloendopeptidase family protein [Rhodoferax sp.]MBU3898678.1 peptidoglycan DD-metalloendopeptidase family protein [Gammaproteobacteria bacterium]MBA3057079.1 peptidoglycan DD-metalloendopeptidase family protein [Rhodoferax sp.]MBU3998469.1 peptidoglycan DD-metalloendopeptidase family protein [Gammaproteobacteria bacterium]MBU4019587.1 peptidoglycan DD-metalloendopeptidase family protein [Gammaproteobacteria bacterium]MBU4079101.1 peptidoglycan DD-metalloendopeptidase fa
MKWITTFLSGALVGALGIYFLGIGLPRPVPVVASRDAVIAPALPCVPVAAVATSEPSAIEMPVSEPSTAPPPVLASPAVTASEAAVPAADQLLIPVVGINASELEDTFNDARGSERRHEAIDILAPTGTQVLAVADGKIAKLFNSKLGGLTVYQFDTSERFAYYYAHLDRYAVNLAEGMTLKRGDLVGYVGISGNADPKAPHLHFAIFELGPLKQWWKGSPINPYPLLGGATRP